VVTVLVPPTTNSCQYPCSKAAYC